MIHKLSMLAFPIILFFVPNRYNQNLFLHRAKKKLRFQSSEIQKGLANRSFICAGLISSYRF